MKSCNFDGCQEKDSLPFKCKLCDQTYCAKHRLPEQHDCLRIGIYQTDEYRLAKKAKTREKAQKPIYYGEKIYGPSDIDKNSMYIAPENRFLLRSSMYSIYSFRKDIINIALITLYIISIIFLRNLSVNALWNRPYFATLLPLYGYFAACSSVAVILVFGGHMLIENYVGRRYKVRTKHVIWLQGLLIGLVALIFPFFILPGNLVFTDSSSTGEQRGRIALSGIIWMFFWRISALIISILLYTNVIVTSISVILIVNAAFSLFSFYLVSTLIPIGMSHGVYISAWKRRLNIYLLIFAAILLIIDLVLPFA